MSAVYAAVTLLAVYAVMFAAAVIVTVAGSVLVLAAGQFLAPDEEPDPEFGRLELEDQARAAFWEHAESQFGEQPRVIKGRPS